MSDWKATPIMIAGCLFTQPVTAECKHGLAIFCDIQLGGEDKHWSLTHLHTGARIATFFSDEQAKDCAELLFRLFDWETVTFGQISPKRDLIIDAIVSTGGWRGFQTPLNATQTVPGSKYFSDIEIERTAP